MTREGYLERFRDARDRRLWVAAIAVATLTLAVAGPAWIGLGLLFASFATYLLFRVGLYELSDDAFRATVAAVGAAALGLIASVALGWLPHVALAGATVATILLSGGLAIHRIVFGAGY